MTSNSNTKNELKLLKQIDSILEHFKNGEINDVQENITSCRKVFAIALGLDDTERIFISSHYLAKMYLSVLDSKATKFYLKICFNLYKQIDNDVELANYFRTQSVYNIIEKRYFEAVKDLILLKKYALKLNDEFLKVRAYIGLGFVNIKINIETSALYFYNKAFKIISNCEIENIPPDLFIDLGGAFMQSKNYKEAIKFLDFAKTENEKNANKRNLAVIHNNLAFSYFKIKDYKNCLENSRKLSEIGENKDPEIIKICLLYEAECLIANKYYNKALPLLKQATKVKTEAKLTHPYFLLIKTYEALNDLDNAYKTVLTIAYKLLKEPNTDHFEEIFEYLFNHLKSIGDYEILCEWQEKYIAVKTQIHKTESHLLYEQSDALIDDIEKNKDTDLKAILDTERRMNTILKAKNQLIEEEKKAASRQKETLKESNKYLHKRVIEIEKAGIALKQNRAFLNSIINQLPVLVTIFDASGCIILSNWENLNTFFEEVDVIGEDIFELFDKPEVHHIYKQALDGKYGTTNTNWRGLEIKKSVTPFYNENNDITYVIDVSTDITELSKANAKLKNANEELSNYASMASHDLKEPARTISSFANLLDSRLAGKIDNTSKEYLDYIVQGSKRMSELVRDLLRYSSMENGLDVPKKSSISDVLTTVKAQLALKIVETNTEINIVNKENLTYVKGHFSLMVSLFQNIISNGIKFQQKQTFGAPSNPIINITVRKGTKDKKNNYLIIIEDNGIGIPKDKFDSIFNLFTRLNGKTDYDGSGIGMSTCKKIVELHNGHIWLDSKIGEGTSFYIELPKALEK